MRNPILILVFAIFLTSCISGGRIIEINDSNHVTESMKLTQKGSGILGDKAAGLTDRPNFSISTTYLLEIKTAKKASMLLDIQMQTSNKTDELDSLILMFLDGEKIEIGTYNSSTVPTKSRQFIVPENLWISIANTEKIQYRLHIGKGKMDVKLNRTETDKLRDFFTKAIQLRDANLPPIPEGLKKL